MRTYILIGCAYIIGVSIIAVLAFYQSYCTLSLRSPKSPELRPLILKSIKFAGACLLLLVLFSISMKMCRHYHINFAVSFIISVLLSLCFLGLCYKFKLSPNDLNKEKSEDNKNKKLLNNQKKEIKNS